MSDADDRSVPQCHLDSDVETAHVTLAEGSHGTSSLTSTLCSDRTAVNLKFAGYFDGGPEEFYINSSTPSQFCPSPYGPAEYAMSARRLLMAEIKSRYGVLFPFWVFECATVPRDRSDVREKPHPSQYYPLHEQREDWKKWQALNSNEIDPGGEISLNEILWHSENPDDVPPFHLGYLILAAIHGSPTKRLTENEIKLCLIRRFYYFSARQYGYSWDRWDDSNWFTGVSRELEHNALFTKSDILKEDRDDTNFYWTINHPLPLDYTFYPRSQTLDFVSYCTNGVSNNTPSSQLTETEDVQLPLQLQSELQVQDRPVSDFPLPAICTIVCAEVRAAFSSSFTAQTCESGAGGVKIPINMLLHPANLNPLNHAIIETNMHNVESWYWIPS